jgi:hypothetical protein
MNKYLFISLLGLSSVACKKTDPDVGAHTPLAAGFDQSFSLHYQQSALLPTFNQPELTVAVADLNYTFCPKNVQCVVGTSAWPTLRITDAQGQAQQVKLPTNLVRPNPAWLDTTSLRANGQRYLLYYTKWELDAGQDSPQKKDFSIVLRITKLN